MIRNNIRNRLIFTYVLIILIPLFVIGTVINIFYYNSMSRYLEQTARMNVSRIEENIRLQMKQYDNLLVHLTKDKQLVECIKSISKTKDDDIEVENIKNLLYGYKNSQSNINVIGLFAMNGRMISSENSEILRISADEQDWLTQATNIPTKTFISIFRAGEDPFKLAKTRYMDTVFMLKTLTTVNGENIGAIGVSIHVNMFEKAMYNINPGPGGYFYITDKAGKLVYSPVVHSIIEPKNKKEFKFVNQQSEYTGWNIWGVISQKEVLQDLNKVKGFILVLCILVFLLLLILAYITSNNLLHPISILRNLMKRAEAGDLSVRFQTKGKDEVNDLGKSFNKMIEEIQQLIDQVYLEQKSKRKAEIAVLQSNIKPHFLYNTLDTIHWMSKKYNAGDIIETVDALATLFRIGLSKGNELIQVKSEIEHANSYLKIQKVRYDDVLEYSFEVEEQCENFYVQKVILQPIIENAIYHGIKPMGTKGKIDISIYIRNGELILEVTDNGTGMSEAKLDCLRESVNGINASTGYGIRNVHQRIVLNYGKQYGIEFESEIGKGTSVYIRHPLIDSI